ncbi:MAG: hypothetical protein AAGI71_11175 [Bacteroidota bacterium]
MLRSFQAPSDLRFVWSPVLRFVWVGLFVALSQPLAAPSALSQPASTPHAHTAIDQAQARPLLDALDHGVTSVEMDVYLVDGRLLVDESAPDPEAATLQAVYLEPLRAHLSAHGGRVYEDDVPLQLLLDIQTEAEATYTALSQVLRQYADFLTIFTYEGEAVGAATIILTGNRPRTALEREIVRYAAYDGRLDDLTDPASTSFMPLISDDWTRICDWQGDGPLSALQSDRLRRVVERVHSQGRKLRLWGLPDNVLVWDTLIAHGVDYVHTQNLSGFRHYTQNAASNTD